MERIRNDSNRDPRFRLNRGARKGEAAGVFSHLLKPEEGQGAQNHADFTARTPPDEVERLLDNVHTLGDELIRKRTYTALKAYRHAVQSFLAKIVHEGVDVEEQTSGTNVLNRKRFSILRIVDQRLERLARGMMESQGEQLELLQRVEEIYGMLVDLLH
ncbi:MAG: YaaR family protein [Spirochaetaceae bacterium]